MTVLNFNYPVTLIPADEGGFLVSFADVPEALTHGEDEADALMRAVDALETALEFYTDGNEDLPQPRVAEHGQITVSPSVECCESLASYQRRRQASQVPPKSI